MKSHLAFRRLPLRLTAALLLTVPASAQLDIVIEYDARGSDPPSWEDRSGTCLTRAVAAAAAHWEALYPDIPATQIEFRYRWYNYFAHGHVGLTPLELSEWGKWAGTSRRTGALTPNKYNCDFWTVKGDGEIAWYVDDDPEEHSEFDMIPRMYNWPSDPGTLNGLAGSPPDDVEVGFEGSARVFDIADSSCSGIAARDGVDLFSVALHEMGHALGLGYRGDRDVKGDGDYDVSSSVHVGGIDVLAAVDSTGDLAREHLLADYALMTTGIDEAARRLPSVIDILTIADINGWPVPDLPRTYRLGTGGLLSWSSASAWLGYVPPTSDLGAVLHSGPPDDVVLSGSGSADGVFVGSLSTLDVGPYTLAAGERVRLDSNASLFVDGGFLSCNALIHHGDLLEVLGAGTLSAEKYFEADGEAEIRIGGSMGGYAQLQVPSGAIRLREFAELYVEQTQARCELLDLDGPGVALFGGRTQFTGLERLVNDGLIATTNGRLEFQPSGTGVAFDLDGDMDLSGYIESGRIEAINDSIIFEAPAADPFGGTMKIGASRFLKVADHLPVDGGEIEFRGDLALLVTAHLDMYTGHVHVNGPFGTEGIIQGKQTWRVGSTAYLDSGNGLHLLGESHYHGGTVSTGAGTVRQAGDVLVHADGGETLIGVPRYLWDGERIGGGGIASFSNTTVESGATFRITGTIGSGPGDGYDGTVVVQADAVLLVEPNWILEGELVLEGGTLMGGTLTNFGTIRGHGMIATMVVNHGTIMCDLPPGFDWSAGMLAAGSTGTIDAGCEP